MTWTPRRDQIVTAQDRADARRKVDLDTLRAERNRRLAASDVAVQDALLSDAGLSKPQKQAWRAYKQALRDIPATAADPANPAWPAPPG